MTRRIYLPPPVAYEEADACRLCSGRKITGQQFEFTLSGKTIAIVDVICPACQGCGRGPRHIGCLDVEHADWDPVDQLDDDDLDPVVCASCNGRGWNAVVAFGDGGRVSHHMRVPCGCAESLMVEAS